MPLIETPEIAQTDAEWIDELEKVFKADLIKGTVQLKESGWDKLLGIARRGVEVHLVPAAPAVVPEDAVPPEIVAAAEEAIHANRNESQNSEKGRYALPPALRCVHYVLSLAAKGGA